MLLGNITDTRWDRVLVSVAAVIGAALALAITDRRGSSRRWRRSGRAVAELLRRSDPVKLGVAFNGDVDDPVDR